MKKILVLAVTVFLIACKKNQKPVYLNCGDMVTINELAFRNTKTDKYGITDVRINQNCLEMTISASGCNGKSREMKLYESEL